MRFLAHSSSATWRRLATAFTALLLALSMTLTAAPPAAGQERSDPAGAAAEAAGSGGVPAARAAQKVVVITVHEEIDRYTLYAIKQRLEAAAASGAEAVVFDIDTPGGELKAALDICQAIKQSPIPNTVAWVHPDAYSAGALISLACREIVVVPGATMGDAAPIMVGLFGMLNELPDVERQKLLIPLLVEVTDSARLRGYDEMLVQGLVSTGVELWLVENAADPSQRYFITRGEYRAIFGQEPPEGMTPDIAAVGERSSSRHGAHVPPIAEDAEDDEPPAASPPGPTAPDSPTAFAPAEAISQDTAEAVSVQLERETHRPNFADPAQRGQWKLVKYVSSGRGLVTLKADQLIDYGLAVEKVSNDEELKQFFGAQTLVRLGPSWSVTMVRFLTNPIIRGVLIILFLLGMFIEMTHPGLILPGTVAACALVAMIVPPMLVDLAAWWEIAAILLGIVLLGLELFVLPGFGVAGAAGLLLLFGGLVGTFVGPGEMFDNPQRASDDLVMGVATLLLSTLVAVVLMYFIGKNFGSLPIMKRLILTTRHGDPVDDEGGGGLLSAMGEDDPGGLSVGTVGVVVTTLRPSGKIDVDGRLYDVVSEAGILNPGTEVRVVSADRFRVGVEPAEEERA